jgi:hypothetical protein
VAHAREDGDGLARQVRQGRRLQRQQMVI